MRMIISDACGGLVESAARYFPEAQWQRCVVHFCRNVLSVVPSKHVHSVADMPKAIHAAEDRKGAQEKATAIVERRPHSASRMGSRRR